ncbi:MAG: RdgB/HAM1 family non-canonical purine NTP pyrophosphatase [Schwartzia sp.]|nr:RdgB/HAM1 family non-canonical purine NTP pyrophosphatase [Schwartzia sp. (in: firmicutes)]
MKTIVIATKNEGKIREMKQAFSNLPIQLLPLSDFGNLPDAVENGITFSANAKIKAKFYMEKTGSACLADDSGIEVEILDGAPGVFSARFAGEHATDDANNEKLLSEIAKKGASFSPAAYRCVLAFVDTDGATLTAEGSCAGVIRPEARGNGGFGYDPYFYIEENKTMAELTLDEKDAISHRGKALRSMADQLALYLRNH